MSNKITSTGIAHVRLFGREHDWHETTQFYQDVLGFRLRWKADAAGIAVFEFGRGPTLSIERVDDADQDDAAMVGRFSGISFGVDSADAAYAALKPDVPSITPPEKMDWGGIVLHVRDPSGNEVTLVQYVSESAAA